MILLLTTLFATPPPTEGRAVEVMAANLLNAAVAPAAGALRRRPSELWSDAWLGEIHATPSMELAYIRHIPTRAELRAGAAEARRLARAQRRE